MAGFKFERQLPHQEGAINAVMGVFNDVSAVPHERPADRAIANPLLAIDSELWIDNVIRIQERNLIDSSNSKFRDNHSRVLDISMETGTGKTYTYTKTLFELNKHFGLTKFIVVVPSLSIKAGTVNFLRSDAAKEHFRQDYGMDMKIHVLESKKGTGKSKRSFMPPSVSQFVQAGHISQKCINILVVNAGMLHSPTMEETFDVSIFEQYHTPMDALKSVNVVTVVDEPHRFKTTGQYWKSVEKLNSQFVLRYGATFDYDYKNLIYELTAADAFNNDLVKGVVAHVEDFKEGENASVKLTHLDGNEARFELSEGAGNKVSKKSFKLGAKESLSIVHTEMAGLYIEKLNKTVVVLSNGLELKKGARINPYSFSMSLQSKMIAQAVSKHFELERDYLTRDVRIKPLSLFFIDNIEEYRSASHEIGGELKAEFEALVKVEIEQRLKTETDAFYKAYLEKSLVDLAAVHGGYFSKDNTGSDDKIAKEVEEILHDKESLLSLGNTRRFIFSKWTLREGWDNPNVFQICKLRSSGSQTSKLQEVGRGLRLPVNEYMSRVKDESFDLHYYVDFTESSFVDDLVDEVNERSRALDEEFSKLTPELIEKILRDYKNVKTEDDLLEQLDNAGIIKRNNDFREGGFDALKSLFPLVFEGGVSKGKIRKNTDKALRAHLRKGRYEELKALWEKINKRVILEYRVDDESEFEGLLLAFFKKNKDNFKPQGSKTRNQRLKVKDGQAYFSEETKLNENILPIVSMGYKSFLLALSAQLSININTLHKVFSSINGWLDINHYLSRQTIRLIKGGFDKFLLDNSFDAVKVSYQQVSNQVHPTKFTNSKGKPLKEINAHDLGTNFDEQITPESYLFEETFFDSPLEKANILNDIEAVVIFTKIPKNSIRIPVAGGGTYSPDFAYIVKNKEAKDQLNLVVETKDKETRALYEEEKKKISHAEEFFKSLDSDIDVMFKTQFEGEEITKVIESCFE